MIKTYNTKLSLTPNTDSFAIVKYSANEKTSLGKLSLLPGKTAPMIHDDESLQVITQPSMKQASLARLKNVFFPKPSITTELSASFKSNHIEFTEATIQENATDDQKIIHQKSLTEFAKPLLREKILSSHIEELTNKFDEITKNSSNQNIQDLHNILKKTNYIFHYINSQKDELTPESKKHLLQEVIDLETKVCSRIEVLTFNNIDKNPTAFGNAVIQLNNLLADSYLDIGTDEVISFKTPIYNIELAISTLMSIQQAPNALVHDIADLIKNLETTKEKLISIENLITEGLETINGDSHTHNIELSFANRMQDGQSVLLDAESRANRSHVFGLPSFL